MRLVTVAVAPILSLLLWASPGGADHSGGPDVTVFITAAQNAGKAASYQHDLEEATRELRDAVRKKKGLRVVEDTDTADVRVEVTDCEQRDAGGGGFGGIKVTPLNESIIRFHAKYGDADIDLKGVGEAYWSRAAKDGAERLLKWIARHEPKR